jgi:hypothetical protein
MLSCVCQVRRRESKACWEYGLLCGDRAEVRGLLLLFVVPPVVLNEGTVSHHRVYPFHHTFSACWALSGFMLTLGGKPFL